MNSQRAQGIQHVAYIVAIQQVGQHRRATGQSRQQQGTVRDTLGPGQVNRAIYACDGL